MIVKKQKNEDVWNLGDYNFLKEKAVPDTINPSLWLNANSNFQAGLFWVVKDKIFQIRGFDEETVSESIYAGTAMSRCVTLSVCIRIKNRKTLCGIGWTWTEWQTI